MTAADKTILDDLASKENLIIPVDEEDITSESGALKFKDKEYDEANFSGKGYKILRKNIVEGKNVLTQEMINEANTVYEIRYDFDLNGNRINVATGSILYFNGGRFSNGILHRQDDSIRVINPTFNAVTFIGYYPKHGNIRYYINEQNAIADEDNILLGDTVYLTKRASNNDTGGGFYTASVKGGYASQGGIDLTNLTLVPIKASAKGVFNVNKYGILPNGEDMSDKLNTLLTSDVRWLLTEGTIYFPAGSYVFKKPINFPMRCVVLGDENGFRNGTYTGTEFDFSDILPDESGETYCITCSSTIKKIKNIAFKSNSYYLVENRQAILTGDGTDAWQETINQANIHCLTNVQHVENCFFTGFSGKCIKSGFLFCNKLHFSRCNICIQCDNDSILTNIYAFWVNNITYRSGALNLINNVRGDSIRDVAFNLIGGVTTFNNICIDWCYKSIYALRGDDSSTSKTVRQVAIKTNALRNVINYNIMDKAFYVGKMLYITDKNTSPYIGIVTLPSEVTINELATDIEIVGSYFNAKDSGPDDLSNIMPNVGITVNCASKITITGNINITMTDITIPDILSDYRLFRRFVEITNDTSTISGPIIINGKKFLLNNLAKNHYNASTIILIDKLDVQDNGTFDTKPAATNGIQVGFAYFCTDRQTVEGSTNGIVIYYAGDNTWVDALGRVIQ